MAKYFIHATETNLIQDQSETFQFRTASTSGRATLRLSSMGEYYMTIPAGSVSEAVIRRTDMFKFTMERLSRALCTAYDNESAKYSRLHLGMANIHSRAYAEKIINNMTPKTYIRNSLKLAQPTKKEVEADLHAEARSLLHNNSESRFTIDEYIQMHLSLMLEQRQAKWQEAVSLFESIETAREEEQNAKYYASYVAEKKAAEDILNGVPSIITKGFSELDSKLNIPLELGLDYKYTQSSGLLEVEVTLEEAINIPVLRCEMLSTGKVSIKNKLMRDLSTEKTRCVLSLAFLLGSYMFHMSPNVDFVRMSIYNRVKSEAYIWVEFKRRDMEKITPSKLEPTVEIYNHATVMNLRVKNEGLELTPIDAVAFKKLVTAKAILIPANNHAHSSLSDY